jgi:hypothetical protein
VFDHTGFAGKEGMFRVVTLGWAQMLQRLKEYAQSGTPTPSSPTIDLEARWLSM